MRIYSDTFGENFSEINCEYLPHAQEAPPPPRATMLCSHTLQLVVVFYVRLDLTGAPPIPPPIPELPEVPGVVVDRVA